MTSVEHGRRMEDPDPVEGRDDALVFAATLQDLVIDSADVTKFLQELIEHITRELAGTIPGIQGAVTLLRDRRTRTAAASTAEARFLDEIQHAHGQGPCLEAMDTGRSVVVHDARSETRWPQYCRAVAAAGQYSILGVPLAVDEGARAALNLFAPAPNSFPGPCVEVCEKYADHAGKALRLAARVSTRDLLIGDLRAALESRTVIDTAAGIIMAQNRCTHPEAIEILRRASTNRNQKLRDLAAAVLRTVSPASADPPATHFDT